jgi:prepilin-type N-terminal cleavage/methylation domain-containing protein
MKSQKGFTLIELLVVISIIALLSSVVLSSLNSARERAQVAKIARDLTEIRKVFSLYQLANNGNYPCFDHDWSDTDEKSWASTYITWPVSPWGQQYHWEHNYNGFTYSISVRNPSASIASALDLYIDKSADSAAGNIRYSNLADRLDYGGMDQTIPFNDCHI